MNELQIGDRVTTKIGTLGTILPPPIEMPLHHFVELDNGHKMWILRRILERTDLPKQASKPRRSRKK